MFAKLYGSLKTLIFSVSLVFLTLLHAITMDLDKYIIIKLHNSCIPPEDVSMHRVKVCQFKVNSDKIYIHVTLSL